MVTDSVKVKASGYAVVHRWIDAPTTGEVNLRAGDVLGAETVSLSGGSARIDFFSGAQIFIEAPAELEIRSAWEAVIHTGRLRAKVLPAARGFVIDSNGRRIVDLGTEFGVDANSQELRREPLQSNGIFLALETDRITRHHFFTNLSFHAAV